MRPYSLDDGIENDQRAHLKTVTVRVHRNCDARYGARL
jgi:hypothetical protein